MGRDLHELLKHFAKSVKYPEVSGFEILELLDVRSKIAERESELSPEERKELEVADEVFLRNAARFYSLICKVANLREMREKAEVPPSYWWWYLEKLAQVEKVPS